MVDTSTLSAVDSAAVVVRRAVGRAEALALAAEGERLRAAAHPGVVEVLASTGDEQSWELRLAHGGRPLAACGPLPAPRLAAIGASVAATLADLHDIGLVHGHLDLSTVLVAAGGRAVLCGLGPPDGVASEPSDDVASLGELIEAMLDERPPGAAKAGRSGREATTMASSLRKIALQARAHPATRRPTARRLAALLAQVAPDGEAVTPRSGRRSRTPAHRARRSQAGPRRLAGVGMVLTGVCVGGMALLGGGGPAPEGAEPVGAPTSCVDLEAAGLGVGCEAPEVVGTDVVLGELRFEVGMPGDEVVVGDWDCDGLATPAVLRLSSGEVFVFDGWARSTDLEVGPAARIESAASIVATPSESGSCTALSIRRTDGTVRSIPVGGGR